MKYLKEFENVVPGIDDENDYYYAIHMEKSIEKFNLALKKINFYDEFYEFLDEKDIPINNVVYIIFEKDDFFVDDNIEPYISYKKLADVYVSDIECAAEKFNL